MRTYHLAFQHELQPHILVRDQLEHFRPDTDSRSFADDSTTDA